jgi:hypothetical protein
MAILDLASARSLSRLSLVVWDPNARIKLY